jgi:SAM-dependent methyltransferase
MRPLDVLDRGLACGTLRTEARDGSSLRTDVGRWMGPADAVDGRVLARARGPVLDLGCGPGRHLVALRAGGVPALGVDISPAAVVLARARGANVIHRSIFEAAPGSGRWGTALLLDGNVGIGGSPQALLHRASRVLRADGELLVELEAPGAGGGRRLVRLEAGGAVSTWFPWARVGADEVAEVAHGAGLRAAEVWADGGRHFARLVRASGGRRRAGGSPAAARQ